MKYQEHFALSPKVGAPQSLSQGEVVLQFCSVPPSVQTWLCWGGTDMCTGLRSWNLGLVWVGRDIEAHFNPSPAMDTFH